MKPSEDIAGEGATTEDFADTEDANDDFDTIQKAFAAVKNALKNLDREQRGRVLGGYCVLAGVNAEDIGKPS